MAECTLFMTHCLRLKLQLYIINLVRTCRISSFCTVAWQLARLLLTRRIARSLGDSGASCITWTTLKIHNARFMTHMNRDQLRDPTFGNRVWTTFTFTYIASTECPPHNATPQEGVNPRYGDITAAG